ncbi:MAG: hypothetical protein ACTH2U_03710 [Brevibacterium sp.]
MSSHEEPIEPDDVIDSTKRTPTERARSAATRAYGAASSGVKNVREATTSSRLIETTESTVNKALGNVAHVIDDAVRSGKVERAFDKAQETVTNGADGVRKLVTRKGKGTEVG